MMSFPTEITAKCFRGFITESILKTDLPANGIVKRRIFIIPKEKVVSTVKQNKDSISFLFFGT